MEHFDTPIMFDLLRDTSAIEDIEAEQEEIAKVVSVIDGVNSCKLINFCTQQYDTRHKSVTEGELD